MTKIDDGGPAFPVNSQLAYAEKNGIPIGMSLHDYYAGQAMQGMLASKYQYSGGLSQDQCKNPDSIAREAFVMADAMIAARAQK